MITLVPYDPNWQTLFKKEKNRLETLLAKNVVIEHIGSTAIPGIHSKPVIDILIGVEALSQFNMNDIHKIESLGYQYIHDYEKHIPHRRFFKKDDSEGKRTHHIHLVNYHSAWWKRHILFRDYLRFHSEMAQTYEALKLKLAMAINERQGNNQDIGNFFNTYLNSHPKLLDEYHLMQKKFGNAFSAGNQYALAKSALVQEIITKAYGDFDVHQTDVILKRLKGYIPQLNCTEYYKKMFQDPDFIRCYGVTLSDQYITHVLERDTNYWDQYGFGPYIWFDKVTQKFVGEGGLNHAIVDGKKEIELTYSLQKKFWGQELALEISRFAINDAFNRLKLDNIVCFTLNTNHQSLRVIEKLGFKYEKDFIHKNLSHKLFRLSANLPTI